LGGDQPVVKHRATHEGKAIIVTGREGPQRCEMPRLKHFLYNRLIDGGEVVSVMR
jgi:hypothetical protein